MKVSHVMAAGVVGLLAFAVASQAQGWDRKGPPGPPKTPQGGPQFNAPMPMPPPWIRGRNVPPPMAMRMKMMQNRGPQGPMPRWGMGRGMQMPRQPGQAPWMRNMGRRAMPQGAPFGRWAQPQANRPMQRPEAMGGCACECPRCHMKFGAPAMQRGPMAGPSPRQMQQQPQRRGDPRADVRRERQPNPARAERAQASRAQGKPSCAGCPGGSCGKQGSCAQGEVKAEKPRVKVPAPPVKKQREAVKDKQPKVLKEKKPDRSV